MQGPLRDMFSFTVLLGVFITCEPAAALASGVSAAGAALALVSDLYQWWCCAQLCKALLMLWRRILNSLGLCDLTLFWYTCVLPGVLYSTCALMCCSYGGAAGSCHGCKPLGSWPCAQSAAQAYRQWTCNA